MAIEIFQSKHLNWNWLWLKKRLQLDKISQRTVLPLSFFSFALTKFIDQSWFFSTKIILVIIFAWTVRDSVTNSMKWMQGILSTYSTMSHLIFVSFEACMVMWGLDKNYAKIPVTAAIMMCNNWSRKFNFSALHLSLATFNNQLLTKATRLQIAD